MTMSGMRNLATTRRPYSQLFSILRISQQQNAYWLFFCTAAADLLSLTDPEEVKAYSSSIQGSHGKIVASEEGVLVGTPLCWSAMEKGKMRDVASFPVLRSPPRKQLTDPCGVTLSGESPRACPEGFRDSSHTLYITSVEHKLWGQLVRILCPKLWEVKTSERLQGASGAISFSGSPAVIVRAKEAISKLLIMVGSLTKTSRIALPQTELIDAGVFCLGEELQLFLWEGETSRFRVDAEVRISPKTDMGCCSAVFAQKVLSQRGSPCVHFDIFLSHPQRVELEAGAVELTLEAASQKGLRSLVITSTDPVSSSSEAEAVAVGMEAFKKSHPASPLKTVHFVSRDGHAVAALRGECEKCWARGACRQLQLRNLLLSLEQVKTEVVCGRSTKQKTDVVVVPLVLESDGMGWGPDSLAVTQEALKAFPQAVNLQPEEILSVPSSAFPEFDCRVVYLVRLEGSQLGPEGTLEAVRKMVRSCLSAFYGSFLESISFPLIEPTDPGLAEKRQWLLVMLEEIDRFLQEFPNTWMKLVQVVRPSGQRAPFQVGDCITTAAELVGVCHPEDPLFLQYLKERPDAFQMFKMQMKEVGCGIRIFSSWGILMFHALGASVELHEWGMAFQSTRGRYLMHCESRADVMEALVEQSTLVNEFKSIRIFFNDKMWFVGLCDEMASLLHRLSQVAFQKQLVSWECSAEPLCKGTIAKDVLEQEILKSDILVTTELLSRSPATIRFEGRRQRVEEAERRFKELLNSFQVLPVPLSNFQSQFVKAHWGSLFHHYFFLEQDIPSVLEISDVVQVVGLDLGKMKEAEELVLKHVCERTVEIAEEVKWATLCDDWKELLHKLGSHQEIGLYETTSTQVTVVGTCPRVTQEVEQSIQEYLWDNSPVEERITSDRPELVARQQNLLHIMSWEHPQVSVQVLPNSQLLILQVSGIRKFVQKAIPAIENDLASLVLGKIPLKTPSLGKYFFGTGARLLQEMALQQNCVATMRTEEIFRSSGRVANSNGSERQGLVKNCLWVIDALGRENHMALLKQDMAAFSIKFCERNICSEAIATFSELFLKELCSRTSQNIPIEVHHPKDDELHVCGIQEDVENALKAICAKIEEYQNEWIEVTARYEKVPLILVEEFSVHGMLPSDPRVSSEILVRAPATVVFWGPRQNVVELESAFKLLLSRYQVRPASLSDLQSQFVKVRWGSLFHKNFFLEQGIAAMLEASGAIQVSGLDLGPIKKAEELIVKQVCEKTVEIAEEVAWATECDDWQELLDRLECQQADVLHTTSSSLVFVVGICPHVTQAEQSIKEYLKDHSPTEERVNITRPELALAGKNLLHIMDWDLLEVDIQVQPAGQILSLKVSGICKSVQRAILVIKADLDSLVLGTLPLKKVALGKYFSGVGDSVLSKMAQEQRCVVRLEMRKNTGCSAGVSNSHGKGEQGLAEISCGVIHAVGRQSDVTWFKQHLADFIAKFHEETVCNAELSAFSDTVLNELCKNTPCRFPVALHHPREKVIKVCGSEKDVENVVGSIYAKIVEAVRTRLERNQQEWLESKRLYETVQWHHMTDAGWSTFDMATNKLLEEAYRKKETKAPLPWEGRKIEINFLKSEASVLSDGTTFKLWREIHFGDKDITPYWEDMGQCLVKTVELQENSEEYQDVVKKLNPAAGGFSILKVERIQNRYLWMSYCWKRSWMEKKNPEGVQNERILYHGTEPKNCRSIQEIGFKSACRKTGYYGQGIYFAVDAARSAVYAKPDSSGSRHQFMFQVRVLTGEYTRGDHTISFPPMKPDGRGQYDSLVDIPRKPSIFVTFFDDYAYPEYLITFHQSRSGQ